MILTMGEARVALGLASTITAADLALLEMLLPLVKSAIMDDPDYGLMYDPEEVSSRVEYYPRIDAAISSPREGTWDSNEAGTKTYFREWGRNDYLQLKHLPVRSVSEIKVDYQGGFGQIPGTFGNTTIWTVGDNYYLDLDESGLNLSGQVFSRIGGWPTFPGSIKVTYHSGYTQEEINGRASTVNASGIKHAYLLTLVKAFRTFKANARQGRAGFVAGAVTSERLGDYSYSLDAASIKAMTGMEIAVPPEAGAKLAPFKHFGLMVL